MEASFPRSGRPTHGRAEVQTEGLRGHAGKIRKFRNLAPRASTMPDFGSESCVGIVGMSFLRSVHNWTYGQQINCPFQRSPEAGRPGAVPTAGPGPGATRP